jgi:hypothetical protein
MWASYKLGASGGTFVYKGMMQLVHISRMPHHILSTCGFRQRALALAISPPGQQRNCGKIPGSGLDCRAPSV